MTMIKTSETLNRYLTGMTGVVVAVPVDPVVMPTSIDDY